MEKPETSEMRAETADNGEAKTTQQTGDPQLGAEQLAFIERPTPRDASLRSISSPSLNGQIENVPYHEKGDASPSTSTVTHAALDAQSPLTYHYLTFATPLP
ncbi:hypothetical protein V490_07920, partial [Pseudogymnoascus sp. VKM F-3557]